MKDRKAPHVGRAAESLGLFQIKQCFRSLIDFYFLNVTNTEQQKKLDKNATRMQTHKDTHCELVGESVGPFGTYYI